MKNFTNGNFYKWKFLQNFCKISFKNHTNKKFYKWKFLQNFCKISFKYTKFISLELFFIKICKKNKFVMIFIQKNNFNYKKIVVIFYTIFFKK